jgi:acyl CoA:acetate/3-ketoacid CoA transferase
MAARSKNMYDVFNWIKDEVIPSCTNIQQNITCENLIKNFEKTYNNYDLTRELMLECLNYELGDIQHRLLKK